MTTRTTVSVSSKLTIILQFFAGSVLVIMVMRAVWNIVMRRGWIVLASLLLAGFVFLYASHLWVAYKNHELNKKSALSYARFILKTQFLSILNPFVFLQAVAHSWGQLVAYIRYGKNLPNATTYQQKTSFSLPFEEEWYIANGGIDPKTSHSWHIINQRHAYDFVIKNEDGQTYPIHGSETGRLLCLWKTHIGAGGWHGCSSCKSRPRFSPSQTGFGAR